MKMGCSCFWFLYGHQVVKGNRVQKQEPDPEPPSKAKAKAKAKGKRQKAKGKEKQYHLLARDDLKWDSGPGEPTEWSWSWSW